MPLLPLSLALLFLPTSPEGDLDDGLASLSIFVSVYHHVMLFMA